MPVTNTQTQYGSVAKFLHWLIFILLLGMLVGGFCFGYLPKEYKGTVYNLHKLTGITILALMIIRVVWAIFNVKPAMPAATPCWQRFAAHIVHLGLYALVIAMPLAGWIGASAAQKYPHIGDFNFKLPVPHEKWIVGTAFDFHTWIAYAIIAFASVHILAALYHHYILKDDVMRRMM